MITPEPDTLHILGPFDYLPIWSIPQFVICIFIMRSTTSEVISAQKNIPTQTVIMLVCFSTFHLMHKLVDSLKPSNATKVLIFTVLAVVLCAEIGGLLSLFGMIPSTMQEVDILFEFSTPFLLFCAASKVISWLFSGVAAYICIKHFLVLHKMGATEINDMIDPKRKDLTVFFICCIAVAILVIFTQLMHEVQGMMVVSEYFKPFATKALNYIAPDYEKWLDKSFGPFMAQNGDFRDNIVDSETAHFENI